MVWLTATLAVGALLLWFSTSFILFVMYQFCVKIIGLPPHLFELPAILLKMFHIPSIFLILPNVLLAGVYFAYRPPESKSFKHWKGWEYFRTTFFPIRMIDYETPKTNDIIRIYAVAPHGVYPVSVIFQFILNASFDYVTVVVTSLLFWIPIVREFACLAGCMPANSSDIVALLDKGRSVLIVPEGMRATLYYNDPDGVMRVLRGIPGENEARKGFVRCAVGSALHTQIQIIPVYASGERELYTVYNGFGPLRWLQRIMLSTYRYGWPVFAFGWWGSPFPKPKRLTLHFGDPIHVGKREVDDIFDEYCNKMQKLIAK